MHVDSRDVMLARLARFALTAASYRRCGTGVVLNYHALSSVETRRHVDLLSQHFEFIGHDELLQRLQRARSGRPFCVLTFDDGKKSNATQTAPELYRLGVPAIFYVVTAFLSSNAPLWFDAYNELARNGLIEPTLAPGIIKLLPHAERQRRLAEAMARAGIEIVLDEERAPMSWDDARSLHASGFTIGAHSVNHEVMTREDLRDARASISKSIATVSDEVAPPCKTFAFPNGNYTADLAAQAIASGVQSVATTDPLWVTSATPADSIPRIQPFGLDRLPWKLSAAAVGPLLTNPDGTGRVYWRAARERQSPARKR